jgi:predicted nucleotidyltransferase
MPPGVRFSPEATIDAVLAARERLVKTLGLRTDVVVEISLHPELVDLLAGDLVSEIEAELRDDR